MRPAASPSRPVSTIRRAPPLLRVDLRGATSLPVIRETASPQDEPDWYSAGLHTSRLSSALDGGAGYAGELLTKRFLLRDFVDADTAAFEACHHDPRSYEFYGIEQHKPGHTHELIDLFRTWAEAQPCTNSQLAIVRRGTPGSLVGCCGVRCAESATGTAEIGIELVPEYWGRDGYAVEVLRALVDANFRIARLVAS